MKRFIALLVMLILGAACTPSPVPPTTASNNNSSAISQNATTAPTQNTSSAPNAAPTQPAPQASPIAASGDAQTPTQICDSATPAETPGNRTFAAYPEMVLQPDVDYRAVICTGAGAVYVDLFEDLTPITVNSFVFLAGQGYYNNTTFHRVIEGFMAQGGDPTGTGSGGPGYQFQEEFVGFLNYDRPGMLAMARTNQPGTNGSQFFITTAAYPSLDYQYTLFGEVLEGQQNVNSIRLRDPQTDPNPGTALDTVVIIADPESVATTYTPPTPATREDVLAGLQSLANDPMLTQESLVLSVSPALSVSEVQSSAPESIREQYGTFLSEYNFAYRVNAVLNNPTCNLENATFMNMTYTVDAYETRTDAEAAFNDAFLTTIPVAMGLPNISTPETLDGTLYTGTTQACNRAATRGLTYFNYGRFIIAIEATVPADGESTPDVWISRFANIFFGRGLSNVLRAEIR